MISRFSRLTRRRVSRREVVLARFTAGSDFADAEGAWRPLRSPGFASFPECHRFFEKPRLGSFDGNAALGKTDIGVD